MVVYCLRFQVYDSYVADLQDLERVEVEYETLPGWKSDISQCRSFADLPLNAQKYIRRVEELVGSRVEWIGVGVGREAMIHIP
jgi:adenylosuccinate synthase